MTPAGGLNLEELRREALAQVKGAADEAALEDLRIRHLGRRAPLRELLSRVGSLPEEERRRVGQEANLTARALEDAVASRLADLRAEAAGRMAAELIDLTAPGRLPRRGHAHPVTRITREIEDIFRGLGYSVARGPEVETDYYNFEALNLPPGHPARDGFDSFFIADPSSSSAGLESTSETKILLRAHTSPMQVRVMEAQPPPIRIIVPGRTYRRDNDATHSPMFHQVEGLLVDEGVGMSDLRGTLEYFARAMFGADREVRMRPSNFPFTEPSVEVDVSCFQCSGAGCSLCGNSGWIEMLGAGMVHPNVLRSGRIDPERYSGFAFGMGIDRIAMLKYRIDDMRTLFDNDVRFIRQF
ncbi:MAG: phenylalanine--tRNA ligase subunit alpha [Candidatus Dormibacteria bacterium]